MVMLNSVKDFFEKERKTVEKYNEKITKELGWECEDVLYSFRGVYAIGVFIYYMDLFIDNVKTDIILKPSEECETQRIYSDKYLSAHYSEYKKVNELLELKMFLQHYYDIGNVIPTWPGANVNRGIAHCYDIPNVYYRRYKKFAELIYRQIYSNTFLNNVIGNEKYDTVEKLLKMNSIEYIEFLKYIIAVIEERDKLIKEILQEKKKDE